jgi:hypothetical protein
MRAFNIKFRQQARHNCRDITEGSSEARSQSLTIYFLLKLSDLALQAGDIALKFTVLPGLLIPMKVVTDSDLIPVSDSDVMPVAIGAKRRWPDHSG